MFGRRLRLVCAWRLLPQLGYSHDGLFADLDHCRTSQASTGILVQPAHGTSLHQTGMNPGSK
jgi:hypothetical protein